MKPWAFVPLDTRKQFILKAVVNDYVRTAEPVGSHTIAVRYHLGVRSATIRNELAELSEMGYLRQPHTSAGRVPSDMGYRFYVDRLMEAESLSRAETDSARHKLTPRVSTVDLILEQTCRILSDLARYTSVATRPAVKGAEIRHISVAEIGRQKLLAVIVLDNGHVLHELLEFESTSRKLDSARATGLLMRKFAGRTLESLAAAQNEPLSHADSEMQGLVDKVLDVVRAEVERSEDTEIQLQGTNYIMQQPEFKDFERLEMVLSALEQRSALYRLLSSVYVDPSVTVLIGSENPVSEMRDCSFVGARYRIRDRVAGTIGVVGPTRMDYHRAVAAVEFMARNLGDLLTQLSVA